MTVLVRASKSQKGQIPSWQGGRMPLTSKLSYRIKMQLEKLSKDIADEPELQAILPIMQTQQKYSLIPDTNTFLIEKITSKEGCHVFFYPFEGRLVHEVLAALMAYRIGQIRPLSFSYAMNDYGFELLCDEDIPLEEAMEKGLFSDQDLTNDIFRCLNAGELARRKFRDIACISGMVFQGVPGAWKKTKHLQASSSLLFNVFESYDPQNLLLRQAYREAFEDQMEEGRLRAWLHGLKSQKITITYPERFTPLSFPIMVDRLREKISSEKLEDRVRKMQRALEQL
jgi:ATP-dependent Lhr-like helicase